MTMEFYAASDRSLLVVFGREITLANNRSVVGLLRLVQREPIAGVTNLHPAYASLLFVFDPLRLSHRELEATLRGYLKRVGDLDEPRPSLIEIPVCYDLEFGLDLLETSQACTLSPQRVIAAHCSVSYLVYFLGFVPGFAYLGDLPEALELPRLPVPRTKVPCGSVAIAGRQTGVYPMATPGGWRILGRTPLQLFDPRREPASVLNTGDRVRFIPISRAQFDAMERT